MKTEKLVEPPVDYNLQNFCSSHSVSGIAVDRFLAVSAPFEYKERVTVTKTMVAIFIMWVYAFSISYLPPLLGYHHWVSNVECYLGNIFINEAITVQCTTVFLVTLIIYMMYAAMFKIAAEHMKKIAATMIGNTSQEAIKIRMHLKAAKTLLLVTGTFSLCWLPFVINLLNMIYTDKHNPESTTRQVQKYLSLLLFFNCVINPIIYAKRLPGFKLEFIRILTCYMYKSNSVEPET